MAIYVILPGAVYCCITRTTQIVYITITSPSFVTLHSLVLEIAKCIVYCCVTRTTLFITINVLLWFVYRKLCIPIFVVIGCCLSELHGHLCPYHNVLPEAVYCCTQELHCYKNFYMFL